MSSQHPPATPETERTVNFLRPRPGYMRREVLLICITLLLWGGLTFGFQFLLLATAGNTAGHGPLTETVVFGFPLHYWFSGQFLVISFIALCFAFNSVIDRLARRYRRRDARRAP